MGSATTESVRTDTEHKIQLWEEHKNKLVGHSIIPDMVNIAVGLFARLNAEEALRVDGPHVDDLGEASGVV